jgi:hypothetical protein
MSEGLNYELMMHSQTWRHRLMSGLRLFGQSSLHPSCKDRYDKILSSVSTSWNSPGLGRGCEVYPLKSDSKGPLSVLDWMTARTRLELKLSVVIVFRVFHILPPSGEGPPCDVSPVRRSWIGTEGECPPTEAER